MLGALTCGLLFKLYPKLPLATLITPNLYELARLTDTASDLLYFVDDTFSWFEGKRYESSNTHGTGCTLSCAIASNLALGYTLSESVKHSKDYVAGAIRDGLNIGQGNGPLNHCYNL